MTLKLSSRFLVVAAGCPYRHANRSRKRGAKEFPMESARSRVHASFAQKGNCRDLEDCVHSLGNKFDFLGTLLAEFKENGSALFDIDRHQLHFDPDLPVESSSLFLPLVLIFLFFIFVCIAVSNSKLPTQLVKRMFFPFGLLCYDITRQLAQRPRLEVNLDLVRICATPSHLLSRCEVSKGSSVDRRYCD